MKIQALNTKYLLTWLGRLVTYCDNMSYGIATRTLRGFAQFAFLQRPHVKSNGRETG